MSCASTTRTPITSAAITARFTGCLPYRYVPARPRKNSGIKGAATAVCLAVLVRHVRLATGLVLFAYVSTHLLNHACGLLGLAAMEAGRKLFIAVWRSPAGAAALYASLATHLALALWSLFQRRQLRIPLWEAAQLLLGL